MDELDARTRRLEEKEGGQYVEIIILDHKLANLM